MLNIVHIWMENLKMPGIILYYLQKNLRFDKWLILICSLLAKENINYFDYKLLLFGFYILHYFSLSQQYKWHQWYFHMKLSFLILNLKRLKYKNVSIYIWWDHNDVWAHHTGLSFPSITKYLLLTLWINNRFCFVVCFFF